MNKGPLILLILLILIVAGLALWLFYPAPSGTPIAPYGGGTPTSTGTPTPTSTVVTLDQSVSDGVLGVSYPSADFGLATNATQILVHPYIPPCDQGFNYCIYYTGTQYQGTNFESAGIRIQKRTGLTTAQSCLTTSPTGFSGMKPDATSSADTYSVSIFNNVGTAAAGHTASDRLYRIFYPTTKACYEIDTRIGQSQFANYSSGSIKEFTATDAATVQNRLGQILQSLQIKSAPVSLPS